jgi:hypothetical protein
MIRTERRPRLAARSASLRVLLLTGLGLSQGSVFAQRSSPAADEPTPTVVVTSTRTPTRVDEQVADLTVLDRDTPIARIVPYDDDDWDPTYSDEDIDPVDA